MADFEEAGVDDQQLNVDEDQTSETNEDPFSDLPDENAGLEEEEAVKAKAEDTTKSEIAQKIKYREKFLKEQAKAKLLEERLKESGTKGGPTSPEQEKELAAQRYIREQARSEYESILAEEKAKEEQAVEAFQEKLDAATESSDFTENQIIDICEDFEVEPEVAVKILSKVSEDKRKPSIPKPKRGKAEVSEDTPRDDSKKTMWSIAQEIKDSLRKK